LSGGKNHGHGCTSNQHNSMNHVNNCIFCHRYPKNNGVDGCCKTCRDSNGTNHGRGCTSNQHNSMNHVNNCVFCHRFPKNNGVDGCCKTCRDTNGTNHGHGCTGKVSNIPKRSLKCKSCKNFSCNGEFNTCCASCSITGGKKHGLNCTGAHYINSNEIHFYNEHKPYYQFTNFYPSPVVMFVKGSQYTFPTTEHYYQYMKYDVLQDWYTHLTTILSNNSPRFAFDYGKKIQLDPNTINRFDSVKDQIMDDVVYAKFTQHDDLRQLLKSTGSKKLVEASPTDKYWGAMNGIGLNKLGQILESVRSRI
jgi:ribA/ribD-fused uncharacterized protein